MGASEEPLSNAKDMNRQESPHTHGIRTQADASVPAEEALGMLKEGNLRYVEGRPLERSFDANARRALAEYGQNPFATIIGCADSRCPLEILFDVQPGDIFVLRNAGNTCTHAEGSMVGSVEYSVGHLHTKLVLVLGHTRCGAIAGATQAALSAKSEASNDAQSSIIEKLLTYSEPLREKVEQGDVVVQGAIYDIVSGKVKFLGPSPRQSLVLDNEANKHSTPKHA